MNTTTTEREEFTTNDSELRRIKRSHGFRTLHRILEHLEAIVERCDEYAEKHAEGCECVHCRSDFSIPFVLDDVATLRGVAEMVHVRIESSLLNK